MQWTALLIQLLFLGLGIYLYLFAVGAIKIKNPERAKNLEQLRKENGRLIRILALFLMAIPFLQE